MCKCNTDVTLYAMWGTKPKAPGTNGADCTVAGHTGKYYGGYCWQWMTASDSSTLQKAETICNSMGWSLPTQDQFQTLLNNIGTGGQLYNAGWINGYYWSSTPDGWGGMITLSVGGSEAKFYSNFSSSSSAKVRCV